MQKYSVKKFKKGWFIGDFKPTLVKTKHFEIAIKKYKTGEEEPTHFHKVATEFTVVTSGLFRINKADIAPGQIIKVNPGEKVKFSCLRSGLNVVIKIPSVKGDKYEGG